MSVNIPARAMIFELSSSNARESVKKEITHVQSPQNKIKWNQVLTKLYSVFNLAKIARFRIMRVFTEENNSVRLMTETYLQIDNE
jgi:hypothetical protein